MNELGFKFFSLVLCLTENKRLGFMFAISQSFVTSEGVMITYEREAECFCGVE